MSMTKLLYSDSYDSTVGVGMELFEDAGALRKSAASVFGGDVSELKPDKDHVGIHVVALGDSEHYGSNRNADLFSKAACEKYHDTFVKFGKVYRHHRNKDSEKNLGDIVKSAYNSRMGRIELFVHAHRERAADELKKLASDGEIPFSMSCKVAFDICSVCRSPRKSKTDPDQCDHLKYEFGKLAEDGKYIGTYNPEPRFFDISFVTRPADRIAWNLKVAADESVIDSVKLAEAAEIWVPDAVALMSADEVEKAEILDKAAEFCGMLLKLAETGPQSSAERYYGDLARAAVTEVSDSDIAAMRELGVPDFLAKSAQTGVVLTPPQFMKYVFGCDYGDSAELAKSALSAMPGVFGRLVGSGERKRACADPMFDADIRRIVVGRYPLTKAANSVVGEALERRVVEAVFEKKAAAIRRPVAVADPETDAMCVKYAAYAVSAAHAIAKFHKADADAVAAVVAAVSMS